MLLFPNLVLFCSATRLISFFFACRLNNRKERDENLFGSKEWHFTLLFSINALINQCLNHWCLHWFHVITHWRERNEKQLIPFILFSSNDSIQWHEFSYILIIAILCVNQISCHFNPRSFPSITWAIWIVLGNECVPRPIDWIIFHSDVRQMIIQCDANW